MESRTKQRTPLSVSQRNIQKRRRVQQFNFLTCYHPRLWPKSLSWCIWKGSTRRNSALMSYSQHRTTTYSTLYRSLRMAQRFFQTRTGGKSGCMRAVLPRVGTPSAREACTKAGNGVNSGLKNLDPVGVGYHMFWSYGSR
jgi:hypothetical protein